MNTSVKKNFILQAIYQLLILGIPLILSPYLTRTLGSNELGIYSYTYSIAYYFVIAATLGIHKYGARIISQVKDDKILLRKTFWSLFILHIILSIISLIGYGVFLLIIKEHTIIFAVQGLFVLSALFDITWLFYGIEDFKNVIYRNTLVKIVEVILIFALVKTTNDTLVYTLILSASIFLGQFIMLPLAIKRIKFIKFSLKDVKEHIKPMLLLSISVLSVSIYSMVNKTLLGIIATKSDVAFYEYSDKIVRIPLSVITTLGMVMLPRMSYLNSINDTKNSKIYIHNSMYFVIVISLACVFGIAGISDIFALLYYGEEFAITGKYILLLSPIILVISIGDVIRSQYLLPKNMDKEFTTSLVVSAILNLILNLALIPFLGVYGAIIGTLITEALVNLLQLWYARNDLPIKKYLLVSIPYLIIGLIMFVVVRVIGMILDINIITLIIQVISGGLIYLILTLIYLFIFDKTMWIKLRSLLRRN